MRTAHRMSVLLVFMLMSTATHLYGQEATFAGIVTDATGAVLPGVTVVATNSATGNVFETVTDARGAFRMPVRVGRFEVRAELPGFRSGLQTAELLVGQVATVNFVLAPEGIEEAVTVTAAVPLLNVSASALGGNVDPTQVQELPVAGRNWMALAMLAPGSRTSSSNADAPLVDRQGASGAGNHREFQLNLDGQQISNDVGTGNQPKYSQDSIAEFQYVSNRFDATQGRSSGIQVNVITKSGTNQLAGLLRANFQSSRFSSEEPVLQRVIPTSNRQFSTTLGGPLIRNRLHFFANAEYENEPRTSVWNTPYPQFNITLSGTATRKIGGGRLDYQLSPNVRVMGKASGHTNFTPFGGPSSNSSPAQSPTGTSTNSEYLLQSTQVLGSRMVNEIKTGYFHWGLEDTLISSWNNHWQAGNGVTTGHPRFAFVGFNIQGNQHVPRRRHQKVWSFRDDLSFSYEAKGRHDVRAGVEFLRRLEDSWQCSRCAGLVDARGGRLESLGIPIEQLFPDVLNVDTWRLDLLSPLVRTYTIGVGNFENRFVQPKIAAWIQDDWRLGDRLTLNLGLRYDVSLNSFANDYSFEPFFSSGRANDIDNIQPRVGAVYQLGDKTVLRGGGGLYYADVLAGDAFWTIFNTQLARIEFANDGRPNFAADPLNGQPLPTYEQATARFCSAPQQAAVFAAWRASGYAGQAPCLLNTLQEMVAPDDYMKIAKSWNSSIGVQRQLSDTMAIEADFVLTRGSNEKGLVPNVNLAYDPATGVNLPYSNANRNLLPWPDMGAISMITHSNSSELRSLQTAFRKRMSNRWQGSATYTLSWLYERNTQPFSGLTMVPFPVAGDLGGQRGLAASDQRHRAVFNGIVDVGRGLQISGLHYLGAGIRAFTNFGGDLRMTGGDGASGRLRPDGSIVPLNGNLQPAQNKTDIRLQQRIRFRRVSIDAIADVFNVFNRPNWTTGTQESAANFGQRVAGQFRTGQVGFRISY